MMVKSQRNDGTGGTGERAKSASRALGIIELLVEAERPFTFTELEQALELPKSSLHELLSVLVAHRFVEFDAETRQYNLGMRVWECGQAYLRHRELVAEAKPVMVRISTAVNETVQLATLDGADIVYLEKVDSSQPVRLQSFVGKREPAYMTALGKALLSGLDEAEIDRRHAGRILTASTPYTITSIAALIQEAHRVRGSGFAVDNEEFAEGLRCIAVPVRGHQGGVVAALGVAVPLMRADEGQLGLVLSLLTSGAVDVSRKLGCPAPVLSATLKLKERVAAEAAVRDVLQREVVAPPHAVAAGSSSMVGSSASDAG